MEPFLGQIIMFGGNFAPRGWARCDGQLLAISSNTSLFSLLGTIYGGDGRTTFALPDLRGRLAIHKGNGGGLTPRNLGSKGGQEFYTLSPNQLPPHNHDVTLTGSATVMGYNGGGNNDSVVSHNFANSEGNSFTSEAANDSMAAGNVDMSGVNATVFNNGGSQSVYNVQPFECVNYIIALQGIFPSRT